MDILTYIGQMSSEGDRVAALAVVEEEELRGFVDVQLQEKAEEVVAWLRGERGMQVALATRNNPKCVDVLVDRCAFRLPSCPVEASSVETPPTASFHPVLTRAWKSEVDVDKLLDVCEQWGLPPESVLVVGDSLGTLMTESKAI